jgi:flagellar biosynthesis protein FliQ
VRSTFIASAIVCFVFTPVALFVAGMAQDAGLTAYSVLVGLLIIALPVCLGIAFLFACKWLEQHSSYIPFGVAIGCIVVATFLWFVAKHSAFILKLILGLAHLWTRFLAQS